MATHFKRVCRGCGKVIAQCRCFSCQKITEYVVCEACAKNGGRPTADRIGR